MEESFKNYKIESEFETPTPKTAINTKEISFFTFELPKKENTELEIYLYEPIESFSVEPLEYWRRNSFRFKILSKMARDFLAIPATSVPIESVFSKAADLVTKKRNRLSPDSIKEIMCLNSWLKLDYII